MRVLVTGGAGYLGSHVCAELLLGGHEVTVVDDFSNARPDVGERLNMLTGRVLNIITGDIRDRAILDRAFLQQRPEAVMHFAALKAVGESAVVPLAYYDVNVAGTINLLQCMQRNACHKLVFSSSATVYGNSSHCPINEGAPTSATSPYGRTKLFVEQIINDAKLADPLLQAINLRYFNPVGAHESGLLGEEPSGTPNNLMPYIAQVAAGLRSHVSVFGADYATTDGTGIRDYIHVCDLATAHIRTLEALPNLSGLNALNLGTGIPYSVLDVIRAFSEASGRPVPYEIVGRRPGDIGECWADPSLAECRLGWSAKLDLAKMCRDTWRWQQILMSRSQ
ncbi:UDP-glucose 4-epimerase GalE [Stenotrophomonas maltophilia]|uniref:UDP-glucose 4-epimerase n=1 Tax=Stenotrophomonas maltophilia (strain R551-3) TaxID=391008 RepID=B4SIJ5_STRM5|nr:UDP-glucose 4-epimerase GalE [Stenotrophomonas maltophilia]ACF50200.1 UDP-glucose 4-epimerase [Stenotrophomonas maltophilia R551-3]